MVLGIFNGDGLQPKQVAEMVVKEMFSPVIMFLLGGFTIAAALSKYHITKTLATVLLARAGTKSHAVLFAVMAIAAFASMWISNVATPVLCFSVIQPILRTLEPGDQLAKSLIMGIALSCTVNYILHFYYAHLTNNF
jgi:di/tricarboxylate transporter